MNVFLRRALLAGTLFLLFLVAWKWPVVDSVIRPTLIDVGVSVSTPAPPNPGLSYPALGIAVPVTESPATSPLEYRDWSEISAALRAGVSLAYVGERFSEARLAFVTGHSSDTIQHPYAAIFAGLSQATIGDVFTLHLPDAEYAYTVTDLLQFSPREVSAFQALEPAEGQRVALVTCWPPLTTARRFVVVGERVTE